MTRIMCDASSNPHDIPASVHVGGKWHQVALRAGYCNGPNSTWPAGSRADVWIDVLGTRPDVDVLDIEKGDATPDQAPGWAKAHNARHGYPAILYCNRATLTVVFNAMEAHGLKIGKDFRTWIATLDGTTRVADMTGVTAVQAYGEGSSEAGGHHIDISLVYDDGWKAPGHTGTGQGPAANHQFDRFPGVWQRNTLSFEQLGDGEYAVRGLGTDNCWYETRLSRNGAAWSDPAKLSGPVTLASEPQKSG